jgi:serine/threonine protein kinase
MAPEQRRGAPEDERSDVFALGVLLYRMLAGKLPFADSARAEIGKAPPLVADVPGLAKLVRRMLEVDPTARPRDAGAVLAELQAMEQGAPATGSTRGGASKGGRRRVDPAPRTGR